MPTPRADVHGPMGQRSTPPTSTTTSAVTGSPTSVSTTTTNP